jgi:hypothetical protein
MFQENRETVMKEIRALLENPETMPAGSKHL